MSWNSYGLVDHSCNAWQADNSIIPRNAVPSSSDAVDDRSYFYIKIVAEFTTHLVQEDEDGLPCPRAVLESTKYIKPFLVPSDRLIHNKASWPVISTMLSAVNIPLDAQPNMLHRIRQCARAMVLARHNAGFKVLPMIVSVFVEDFLDYIGEEDDGEDGGSAVLREALAEGMEEARRRQEAASEAALEALETVRIGGASAECVICQEEITGGTAVKRMPCAHDFHGECIVRWLGVSTLCPLSRFPLPAAYCLLEFHI
ncbi:RING-type E3 ubiquitin transferase [Sarracenia purpurea var. burkii]